jgi:hypothetical protein
MISRSVRERLSEANRGRRPKLQTSAPVRRLVKKSRLLICPGLVTIVTIEQPAQAPQDRTLFPPPPFLWGGLKHPAGKPGEWKRLEPYPPGASQGGKEETFTAEKGGFYPPGLLDVEIHRGLDGHDAPGIHVNRFARRELPLHSGTPRMDEDDPVPFQFLHDEALAAEKPGEDLPLEKDADGDSLGGAEEAVFLADEGPADALQG